jgi:D-lactate dehydrogenase (cytochrome)
MSTLMEDLVAAVGDAARVSDGASVRALHGEDLSRHADRLPDVVVFAQRTAEVAAVLAVADARRVPVTPFGAGTSIDGHVLPLEGGISLDLTQMDRVLALRPEDATITVQPGVTRSAVGRHAGEHGLMFPVDPGADATVGGMAATNASGTTTVRYGNMRRQVLGLEVALPGGSVVRTGGRALKSSAGYDIGQLFVGSEGTLGVITELTLRLHPIPEHVVAARAAFPDLDAACRAARAMVSTGVSVTRIELIDAYGVAAMNRFRGTDLPETTLLLLEFAGSRAAVEADVADAALLCAEHGCATLPTETDPTARAQLWRARHELAFALADLHPGGRNMSTDVCVPISELPGAVAAARATLDRLGIAATIVGHVGEGNYHVTYVHDPGDPASVAAALTLEDEVVAQALACGGTCSGEHGIGMGKIAYLEAEHGDLVPLMRAIKGVMDPHGILNPGKVLRPGS